MWMTLLRKTRTTLPPTFELPKDVSQWSDSTIEAINEICSKLASNKANKEDALKAEELLQNIESVLKRTPEYRKLRSIENLLNSSKVSVYVADVRIDYEQLTRALYRYRQLH